MTLRRGGVCVGEILCYLSDFLTCLPLLFHQTSAKDTIDLTSIIDEIGVLCRHH